MAHLRYTACPFMFHHKFCDEVVQGHVDGPCTCRAQLHCQHLQVSLCKANKASSAMSPHVVHQHSSIHPRTHGHTDTHADMCCMQGRMELHARCMSESRHLNAKQELMVVEGAARRSGGSKEGEGAGGRWM